MIEVVVRADGDRLRVIETYGRTRSMFAKWVHLLGNEFCSEKRSEVLQVMMNDQLQRVEQYGAARFVSDRITGDLVGFYNVFDMAKMPSKWAETRCGYYKFENKVITVDDKLEIDIRVAEWEMSLNRQLYQAFEDVHEENKVMLMQNVVALTELSSSLFILFLKAACKEARVRGFERLVLWTEGELSAVLLSQVAGLAGVKTITLELPNDLIETLMIFDLY